MAPALAQKEAYLDAPVLADERGTSPFRIIKGGQEPSERQRPAGSRTAAQRGELKYLLDENAYQAFRAAIRNHVEPDMFACSQVCSLYLDTADNAMVRRSIEKPTYKEKLRIRTYKADATLDDHCFVEIKKKSRGTVYKRRVEMTLREATEFCRNGALPEESLGRLSDADHRTALQILQEMTWLFSLYGNLRPSFNVSCKRLSLKERGTDSLRITFDRAIAWSEADESYIPRLGDDLLNKEGTRVMEIKAAKAIPLWLVRILDDLNIYPQSFSKVGKSYNAWIRETKG